MIRYDPILQIFYINVYLFNNIPIGVCFGSYIDQNPCENPYKTDTHLSQPEMTSGEAVPKLVSKYADWSSITIHTRTAFDIIRDYIKTILWNSPEPNMKQCKVFLKTC